MSNSQPALPTDRVRLHVALWNMARALGLNWTTVDASRPDHELVEEIAAAVTPALARVFREGFGEGWVSVGSLHFDDPPNYEQMNNPYAEKT